MTISTQQKIPQANTFMVYYQGLLCVAAILVFFSRLDGMLAAYNITIPLVWLIGFMAASIPLFLTQTIRLQNIPLSILVWCGVYLGICSISILIEPQAPSMQLLEDQIRSIIFLVFMLMIFAQPLIIQKWVKITILLVTIANVLLYIYEFINPATFALVKDVAGRSGGFYVDANTAACALIMGLIFSISLIKPKYRLFYALFTLMGIATTFSRGGMACWLMVVVLMVLFKIIPSYQFPLFFLSIFVTTTILSTQVGNLSYMKTADGTDMFTDDTIRRIEFLLNPFNQSEQDFDDSRLNLADEARAKFMEKPIFGGGLDGARLGLYDGDSKTQEGAGTHNIYLDSALKYGFLGILIYPLLIFVIISKAEGEIKNYALIFAIFSLAWGFFSHTTLDAFFSLMCYVIMASWIKQSQWEKSFQAKQITANSNIF